MRVLFDTSVLVAALLAPHPRHSLALPWLKQAKDGEIEFLVSTHSLAELYSTLSSIPVKPKIEPAVAWRLVEENVASSAQLVSLTADDYTETIRRIAGLGLPSGVIYDALIAKAAEKSRAERLLTFNEKDFRRAWPEGQSILLVP